MAASIHLEWTIDEKVKIIFIELIINPDSLALTADKMIAWVIKLGEISIETAQKGAIFCQVKTEKTCGQLQLFTS